MGSFSAYLGKGLSEPCSPFRQTNVFGAPLNSPNAAGWNCLANIVGSTTKFDLSGITENHEVCVALATVKNTLAGTYSIRFSFYKKTPYQKLFDYTFSYSVSAGQWLYAYAFIGWTSWEINENGDYFVSIGVGGPESFSQEIDFTITGISVPEPVPPVPSGFMGAIVTALNTISALFYSAYVETYSWIWPFNYLSTPFYYGSLAFSQLAWRFSDFGSWVNDISSRIQSVLSWSTIWNYLLSYVPNLVTIRDWFYSWWANVTSVVTSWWSATSVTVQAWIRAAGDELKSYINSILLTVNSLSTSWDNFKGRIPTIDQLVAWWGNWTGNVTSVVNTWWSSRLLEVQGLINSAFTARQSLWAGWQEMKANVVEFFTDPVEFIWERFTDWFLGPEV